MTPEETKEKILHALKKGYTVEYDTGLNMGWLDFTSSSIPDLDICLRYYKNWRVFKPVPLEEYKP